MRQDKEHFIAAMRKFMGMKTLTALLFREIIDCIDVCETEGVGKKRTQRIVIFYRFVGHIEIRAHLYYTADTWKVETVEYVSKAFQNKKYKSSRISLRLTQEKTDNA